MDLFGAPNNTLRGHGHFDHHNNLNVQHPQHPHYQPPRDDVGQSDIPTDIASMSLGVSQRTHPLLNQSDNVQFAHNNGNVGSYTEYHPQAEQDDLAFALMYPQNPPHSPQQNVGGANGGGDEQKQYYIQTQYYQQYYGHLPPQQQQQQQQHPHSYHHHQYYNQGAAQQQNMSNVEHFDVDLTNPTGFDFANPNNDYLGHTQNTTVDQTKIESVQQNEIQLEAEIGRGSSSKVFKARWRNIEVAAKRFTKNFGIDSKKSAEYIEKYAMKLLEKPHENVIKIMAYSNKPFTILTEYMNYGSVKNYVRRTRPGSTSISILDRIEISLQAAKGIQHLHSLNIIHSEINCQNLLMEFTDIHNDNDKNEEYSRNTNTRNGNSIDHIRVVVTDYALQQMLTNHELEQYRSSLGPLKWMAPECIENGSCSTLQSDIYAFGITMWEIITGQEPYPDVDPVDTAIHVLVKERRPQSYAFIPEQVQNLMKICWHKDKDKRPNADTVVKTLTEFVQLERKQHSDRNDLVN